MTTKSNDTYSFFDKAKKNKNFLVLKQKDAKMKTATNIEKPQTFLTDIKLTKSSGLGIVRQSRDSTNGQDKTLSTLTYDEWKTQRVESIEQALNRNDESSMQSDSILDDKDKDINQMQTSQKAPVEVA